MTRVHPLAPVVALDIDGTLGDHHKHFEWFASLYMMEPRRAEWRDEDLGEFSDALGLDKRVYRDIKLAYRQGGMKRSMPVFDGARELVAEIRAAGVQAWIATTRPWMRLDNIDPDTRFWVERNLGEVDGLIYGEDKYLDLIDIVGRDRIVGVVDDLPENITHAYDLGLRVAVRAQPWNAWWRDTSDLDIERPNLRRIPAVRNCDEMAEVIEQWITKHKEKKP